MKKVSKWYRRKQNAYTHLLLSVDCAQAQWINFESRLVVFLWWDQGPVSISDKTSYCKISQNLEAARFLFILVRSLWNLTGISAAPLWCDDLNSQTCDFQISRDLMIRFLIGYWNGIQDSNPGVLGSHSPADWMSARKSTGLSGIKSKKTG